MHVRDVLTYNLGLTDMIVKSYLGDLDDADLARRPHPKCKSIADQLAHLIKSDSEILNEVRPGAGPEMPADFLAVHGPEAAPGGLLSKSRYLELYDQVTTAAKQLLAEMSDADFDAPSSPRFREWAPTNAAVLVLAVNHATMHAGQWVPVRRELGKPVVI